MNKEIETQYEKILGCSTLSNLRKIEDELLMIRMLLINYHNICFNYKQALNKIREYINNGGILGFRENGEMYTLKEDRCGEDILQIISEAIGDDDSGNK